MRGVAFSLLCVFASCAPDYGHSAFRCDADHGCPDGQLCTFGRCRRGMPTGDGRVVCGAATCELSQQCCLYLFTSATCIPAGDVCPDDTALCDGVEDCQAGDRCCTGDTQSCAATCQHYACRDDDDCPSTARNCCEVTAEKWGECSQFGC